MLLLLGNTALYVCKNNKRATLQSDKTQRKQALLFHVFNGVSKREILAEHEKHCEGIEGKPTRIEMPNENEK